MNGLIGKRALITGGSGDIGTSIAMKLAYEGVKVGIQYNNNKPDGKEFIKTYKCDFSRGEEVNLIQEFINDFSGIDILINNAGILSDKSFFDMELHDYDNVFHVNSRSAFILAKDAFKWMKEAGYGRIINISSFVTKYGMGRNNTIQYAASKATLDTLTIGLSRLGAEHNILVNSISPGVIATKLQTERTDFKYRIGLIPVGHAGTIYDISDMVAFLASESGSFITGQIIGVTGGE